MVRRRKFCERCLDGFLSGCEIAVSLQFARALHSSSNGLHALLCGAEFLLACRSSGSAPG